MATQPELKYLCRKSDIKSILLYLQALCLCLILVKHFQSARLLEYNCVLLRLIVGVEISRKGWKLDLNLRVYY